jgi:hypothetical protein
VDAVVDDRVSCCAAVGDGDRGSDDDRLADHDALAIDRQAEQFDVLGRAGTDDVECRVPSWLGAPQPDPPRAHRGRSSLCPSAIRLNHVARSSALRRPACAPLRSLATGSVLHSG